LPKKFTVMDVVSGVLSLSTIVAGVKSQAKLKSGQGSIFDALNTIKGRAQLESMKTKEVDFLGKHALYLIDEKIALQELKVCCSSEDVSLLRERIEKIKSASFTEDIPTGHESKVNFFTKLKCKKIDRTCNKVIKTFRQIIDPNNPFVLKYETWINSSYDLLERALWRNADIIYELEINHTASKNTFKIRSQKEVFFLIPVLVNWINPLLVR